MDTHFTYGKFEHPDITAKGDERAFVDLSELKTLWFNTGSLCNIACKGCYMDSSPKNDALSYLKKDDVQIYLDEIKTDRLPVTQIGLTGGEPFMNPDIIEILTMSLERGFDTLVLTNAMKPLHHKTAALLNLKKRFGDQLILRVSIDHYTRSAHESLRGEKSWAPMIEGLQFLSENSFHLAIAGRTLWHENDTEARAGYRAMLIENGISLDVNDPEKLVLFPEMDGKKDVPEITTACWDILGISPQAMMCATSRMVVKPKGADHPVVAPCTLLPYDETFHMGQTLKEAAGAVKLNHPHCAKFCVLGGGSCSAAD